MANLSTTLVAEELISYSVVTDKNGLVKLLERNGVQMPNNPSDREVTVAVLMASAKSQNFKDELAAFLTKKVGKAGDDFQSFVGSEADFGFTGVDDFGFTGEGEDFYNIFGLGKKKKDPNVVAAPKPTAVKTPTSRVTTANPQGKTKAGLALAGIGKFFKDNILTAENINAGIAVGLNKINNKTQADSNRIQEQALVLQSQQDDLKNKLPDAKPMSPAVKYTLIGVGVIALVGIIYVIVKKKK
jgi:hypothetical protein